ncbi:MAG TPA: DUF2914 domain-containing protein [Patescibacteria group bacterium]|nr:DUF2914 domain-containing protein [Patescibacteria group bacterium]
MFIWLGIYIFLAAASILYVFIFDARSWKNTFLQRLRLAVPLLSQLAFGSLLSMAFLFYWFSGAVSVSWPIFLILLILIIFNEAFREAYLRPTMQMTLFSFVLLSYLSILFPYLFNSIDPLIFFLSGGVSSIISIGLAYSLVHQVPHLRTRLKGMVVSIVSVFLGMSALYFFNIIPPIPLSIRDAGIYHSIQRHGNDYQLIGEPKTIWQELLPFETVHGDLSSRIYAFTAIYSPADLNTVIYHVWQFYDPMQKKWVTKDRLSFPMTGGRMQGFRGYTYKTHLEPGHWRVNVETARGQVIGRISFAFVSE